MSGLFLSIASLFRPVGHYVIFFSSIMLLFSNFSFSKKLKNILVLFLGWFLIVLIWLLRNFLLTGFLFLHTLPGRHFLNHTTAYVLMDCKDISYSQAKEKLIKKLSQKINIEEKQNGRKLYEIEECILAERISFKYFFKHPFLTIKYGLSHICKTALKPFCEELFFIEEKNGNKINNFLFPKMSKNWFRLIVFLDMFLFLFLLIGFLGFIINSIFNKDFLCVFSKTFPLILLFIVITFAAGFARLRLPVEPLIIILSVSFWMNLINKLNRYKWNL